VRQGIHLVRYLRDDAASPRMRAPQMVVLMIRFWSR
jgi:hypothetical protein